MRIGQTAALFFPIPFANAGQGRFIDGEGLRAYLFKTEPRLKLLERVLSDPFPQFMILQQPNKLPGKFLVVMSQQEISSGFQIDPLHADQSRHDWHTSRQAFDDLGLDSGADPHRRDQGLIIPEG